MAAPCGTAKFREETSKKQRAEASLRCTIYVGCGQLASRFLQCSIKGRGGVLRQLVGGGPQSGAMRPIVPCLLLPMLLPLPAAQAWPSALTVRTGSPAPAARPVPPAPGAAQLCRAAIAATERVTRIPDAFLNAISRVETGRPAGGAIDPWPWTVNAAGAGHFYDSKEEAVAAVRRFMAAGIRSLDVGCLQVNLFYHPDAFGSLEQAFDPAVNAAYAGKLLLALFAQTGSWPRAAAAYHSLTPALGEAYQKRVLEAWATPDRPGLRVRQHHELGPGASETRPAGTLDGEDPPDDAKGSSDRQQSGDGLHTAVGTALAGAPSLLSGRAVAESIPPAMRPPALAFNQSFALPQRRAAIGRSLADYRAMSVRVTVVVPRARVKAGTAGQRLSQD